MRNMEPTEILVACGRFKGKIFWMENELKDMPGGVTSLAQLAAKGNWAAKNALFIDKYKEDDGPFYYGKIDSLGYIISKYDLGI